MRRTLHAGPMADSAPGLLWYAMARPSRRKSPTLRLTPLMAWVGAAVCLAGAIGLAVDAGLGLAPLRADVTGIGRYGDAVFVIDPGRAVLLASAALAAGAWMVATIGRRDARPAPLAIGLVLAGAAAILAQGLFTGLFAGLGALVLAALMTARRQMPHALSLVVMPAVIVAVIGFDLPRAVLEAASPILLAGGAIAMLAGAVVATRTLDLFRMAAALALGWTGLAVLSLGLGDPGAAGLAIGANAVIVTAIGLIGVTLFEATGTVSLDWLGGLARGMPRFALLMLGVFGFVGVLPPGPGFAAMAGVMARAIREGDVMIVAALGVWIALMVFAALRGFGLAALGRPRSLRAAAAEDAERPVLIALGLLLAGGLVLGLARWADFVLAVALIVIAFGVRAWLVRSEPAEIVGFDDGFARPPAWLPFGDPATQITATGFALGMVAPAWAARWTGMSVTAWRRLRARSG